MRKERRRNKNVNWIRNFVMNSNFISSGKKRKLDMTDYCCSYIFFFHIVALLFLPTWWNSIFLVSFISSTRAVWENIICICIEFTANMSWIMFEDYQLPSAFWSVFMIIIKSLCSLVRMSITIGLLLLSFDKNKVIDEKFHIWVIICTDLKA
jgi:hypothetical protein